jgi:hypothetical protein
MTPAESASSPRPPTYPQRARMQLKTARRAGCTGTFLELSSPLSLASPPLTHTRAPYGFDRSENCRPGLLVSLDLEALLASPPTFTARLPGDEGEVAQSVRSAMSAFPLAPCCTVV